MYSFPLQELVLTIEQVVMESYEADMHKEIL